MRLSDDYLALVARIRAAMPLPAVRGLYLPRPEQENFRDEFGFVLLESGDSGAFYVSLDDTLPSLWEHYPAQQQANVPLNIPLETWLDKLGADTLAERALGLGAFNALSQYILRRANYRPSKRQSTPRPQTSLPSIGMVGYFCPLVERLTGQGQTVVVLEKHPERVTPHPLVQVVTTPRGLAHCSEILCTAATLINHTLDEILAACPHADRFNLIGPSAGGLPDVVFARGVDAVGAISFPDQPALLGALAQENSWGSVGQKYEINRADYPGVEALLRAILPPAYN